MQWLHMLNNRLNWDGEGMTRDALNRFVRASERSPSLRRELKTCLNVQEWIKIAQKYGFDVTSHDLNEDSPSTRVAQWFDQNKISTSFRL